MGIPTRRDRSVRATVDTLEKRTLLSQMDLATVRPTPAGIPDGQSVASGVRPSQEGNTQSHVGRSGLSTITATQHGGGAIGSNAQSDLSSEELRMSEIDRQRDHAVGIANGAESSSGGGWIESTSTYRSSMAVTTATSFTSYTGFGSLSFSANGTTFLTPSISAPSTIPSITGTSNGSHSSGGLLGLDIAAIGGGYGGFVAAGQAIPSPAAASPSLGQGVALTSATQASLPGASPSLVSQSANQAAATAANPSLLSQSANQRPLLADGRDGLQSATVGGMLSDRDADGESQGALAGDDAPGATPDGGPIKEAFSEFTKQQLVSLYDKERGRWESFKTKLAAANKAVENAEADYQTLVNQFEQLGGQVLPKKIKEFLESVKLKEFDNIETKFHVVVEGEFIIPENSKNAAQLAFLHGEMAKQLVTIFNAKVKRRVAAVQVTASEKFARSILNYLESHYRGIKLKQMDVDMALLDVAKLTMTSAGPELLQGATGITVQDPPNASAVAVSPALTNLEWMALPPSLIPGDGGMIKHRG
jgi:hypothetical protein